MFVNFKKYDWDEWYNFYVQKYIKKNLKKNLLVYNLKYKASNG